MSYTARPEAWFWILAVFLLGWNIAGLFLTIYESFFFDEAMLENMTAAQLDIYQNQPSWVLVNTYLAVITGLIGSIGMLMKRRFAVIMFAISLICIIINTVYAYLVIDGLKVLTTFDIVMSILVVIIGLIAWYANNTAKKRGWFIQTKRFGY